MVPSLFHFCPAAPRVSCPAGRRALHVPPAPHGPHAPPRRAQLDWWQRELDGAAVLALPTDAPRPSPARVGRCGWLDVEVDGAVVPRLEALAVQCGATLFMLLLAALQLLLAAHGRTDDVTARRPLAALRFRTLCLRGPGCGGARRIMLAPGGTLGIALFWTAPPCSVHHSYGCPLHVHRVSRSPFRRAQRYLRLGIGFHCATAAARVRCPGAPRRRS